MRKITPSLNEKNLYSWILEVENTDFSSSKHDSLDLLPAFKIIMGSRLLIKEDVAKLHQINFVMCADVM